jgi:hypothetical protein
MKIFTGSTYEWIRKQSKFNTLQKVTTKKIHAVEKLKNKTFFTPTELITSTNIYHCTETLWLILQKQIDEAKHASMKDLHK